jgi:hypothetical protein
LRAGELCCAALRACFAMSMPVAFISAHFLAPHVRFVVRTRVMCQAGRARAAGGRRRGDIVAWLCERAPLWVVVHVCALLRTYLNACRALFLCDVFFSYKRSGLCCYILWCFSYAMIMIVISPSSPPPSRDRTPHQRPAAKPGGRSTHWAASVRRLLVLTKHARVQIICSR